MDSNVYIVKMARSPIASVAVVGKNLPNTSSVSTLPPHELAAPVLQKLFESGAIQPEEVKFFFMGSAISQKVERRLYPSARFVFRKAFPGKDMPVIARTVEKACSTGLIAIWCAAQKIAVGKADITVGGGVDMMSRQPNEVILAGLTDPTTGKLMAELADQKAQELGEGFTREKHDTFALESYQRAKDHLQEHTVVPIRLSKNTDPVLTLDELVSKYGDRLKSLRRMPPFPKCQIITMLNSSKSGDGCGFMVLTDEKTVRKKNLKPLARIVAFAEHSEEQPKDFIVAPIGAVHKAIHMAGLSADEIDIWENNEAFVTSPLALMKEFNIPRERINIWGGAVAHGHPIGATGDLIADKGIMLLHKLQKRYLMVVICNATSEATAMIFERA